MAKLTYAIEQSGLKHLELTYRGFVYDGTYITVTLDGKELGAIPDKIALKAGQEFLLADGTTIYVSDTSNNGIEARYNGITLIPFAPHKDVSKHHLAYVVTYFIGFYSLLLALIVLATGDLAMMSRFILYWLSMGGAFVVLGYFVKRARAFALAIAFAWYAADIVPLFLFPALQRHFVAGNLLYHLALLYPLFMGIGAIRRMTREDENQPKRPLQ